MSSIDFILNNKPATYAGNLSARLLDVLRDEYRLTGTKCGCMEGECGACSVIIDGKLRTSCLVSMGSLQDSEVLTIEGYSKTERFKALDEAYAAVSAVQCGFCIPGMILASECLLASNPSPTEDEIREAISGNLCRCTGYNAIVKATGIAAKLLEKSTSPDPQHSGSASGTAVHRCTANTDMAERSAEACLSPATLKEALLLRKNNELIPYSGGTDLMVDEKCREHSFLYLGNISELKQISEDGQYIRFGAMCTFSEVIDHPLTPGILREMCRQVAAPAIRNAGTLGGNIGNGSAKADSALIFMLTDSKLRLMSADSERIIPIKDFYLGGGKLALKPDELIIEILMPKHGLSNYYVKKVGARNALAISRVSFAGIIDVQNGIIQKIAVAFGAVIDTIIRFEHIDEMFIGKTLDEAKVLKDDYLAAYDKAITPRRGRVGVEYRKDVCMNLLRDSLDSNGI